MKKNKIIKRGFLNRISFLQIRIRMQKLNN